MIEKFKMEYFFIMGMIVFLIVAVGNIFTLSQTWGHMFLSAKVTACAMVFFYFLLVVVFYKNYTNLKVPTPEMSEEELNELTKE